MKKKYDSPSIQKVSFRYRDQVVAASGDGTENNPDNSGTSTSSRWERVWNGIQWILQQIFG